MRFELNACGSRLQILNCKLLIDVHHIIVYMDQQDMSSEAAIKTYKKQVPVLVVTSQVVFLTQNCRYCGMW